MTPYELGILMHYYVSGADYEGKEPIAESTLCDFVRMGLLRYDEGLTPRYASTKRLESYCEALCMVPLPEWRVIWPENVL